jgi:hypothetical protein
MSVLKETGGQAFPMNSYTGYPDDNEPGMTLRDYFAAKAMMTLYSAVRPGDKESNVIAIPETAYKIADQMLKEREK